MCSTAMISPTSAAVAVTGVAGRNTTLTERRVRYMNLGGILGAIFGGGIVLRGESDDHGGIATVCGITSIAGGSLGVRASRPSSDDQSRWNGTIDGSLAVDNAPTIHPFAGWSHQNSEARIGFEVKF